MLVLVRCLQGVPDTTSIAKLMAPAIATLTERERVRLVTVTPAGVTSYPYPAL